MLKFLERLITPIERKDFCKHKGLVVKELRTAILF